MLIQPIQQTVTSFRHVPDRDRSAGSLIDFRQHGPSVVGQQVFMARSGNHHIARLSNCSLTAQQLFGVFVTETQRAF